MVRRLQTTRGVLQVLKSGNLGEEAASSWTRWKARPDSRRRRTEIGDGRSREICSGGVGFETSSASGGWGAVLVSNSTRPGIHGVSVLVVGIRLGLRVLSKADDNHGNANWETCAGVCKRNLRIWSSGEARAILILPFDTGWPFSRSLVMIQADSEIEKPL
jgi:hypothetical protein